MRPYCSSCAYPIQTCLCAHIVHIQNPIKIKILQHPKEAKHALNTVHIARLCLENIEVRSAFLTHHEYTTWLQDCALIFPHPQSKPLPKDYRGSLVFIDATWPKARGIFRYNPALKQIPCYHLVDPPKGEYRIRKTRTESNLSTLEAMVAALRYLENDPLRYQPLIDAFRARIDGQIQHMGDAVFIKNYLS